MKFFRYKLPLYLILIFSILLNLTTSYKFSQIVKYIKTGDFLYELQQGKFNWNNFILFIKFIPFEPTSSIESVKYLTDTIFPLIDKHIDVITSEYMRIVDLKHGDSDVKFNMPINIKVLILSRISEMGINVKSLMPEGYSKPLSFIGGNVISKLPTSLLFITYGVDQGYYVDYTKFEKVSKNDLYRNENNEEILKEGSNLAEFAENVKIYSQECGSCLAFSTSAVLTHFYYRYYLSLQNKIDVNYLRNITDLFVEPYQLISCANNELKIEQNIINEYSKLFPNSNGYYAGHACFGGMSPEMLFWAKYNTDKLGFVDNNINLFNKVDNFRDAIYKYSIKLGKFCNDVTRNVIKPQLPFPKFNFKLVDRNLFKNFNKKEIAINLMKVIKKFGFIFSSLYYDSINGKRLFDCKVSEAEREHTRTYHYVAIAGVEYIKNNITNEEEFKVLIHNSWGGKTYDKLKIFDGYLDCNMANAMFVLEPLES